MLSQSPWKERKDVAIALNDKRMAPGAIEGYVNPLIFERLREAASNGWEPEGPTDVMTLWRHGRLECQEYASIWTDEHTYSLQSVTIRLQRLSSV